MPVAAGINFYASESLDERSPVLLLIHGAGGNNLYWPPQIRRMAAQRIIAIDLPGHGKSQGSGHQRIQEYADDLLLFMKDLRLDSAILIGHSMGGAIALEIAIHHPGKVRGLVLVATGARLRVDSLFLEKAGNADSFESAIQWIGQRCFAASTPVRLKQLALKRLAEAGPSVLHGDLTACQAFDISAWLSRLNVPVRILCGAEDAMTPPKYSQYLQDHIAGSELRIIPDAGHMVMLERPDVVAREIENFVGGFPHGDRVRS